MRKLSFGIAAASPSAGSYPADRHLHQGCGRYHGDGSRLDGAEFVDASLNDGSTLERLADAFGDRGRRYVERISPPRLGDVEARRWPLEPSRRRAAATFAQLVSEDRRSVSLTRT